MKDKKFLRTVKGATRGDQRSFEKLMQARGRNILYIAYSILRDKSAAEEVAQEVAIAVQRSISQLKNPEYFDTWVYKIVYNRCMKERQKMNKTQTNTEIDSEVEEIMVEERDEFLPAAFIDNAEKRRELMAAIDELPDKHRTCLMLYYYDDLDYKAIADIMDISLGDVANSLTRARKRLRCELLATEDMVLEANGREKSLPISKSAGIISVPVLSQAFQMHEGEAIDGAMLDRFMGSALNGVGTTATGAAAGVGSVGVVALVGEKLGNSTGAKAAIAAAVALAVGGGACLMAELPTKAVPPQLEASVPVVSPQQPEAEEEPMAPSKEANPPVSSGNTGAVPGDMQEIVVTSHPEVDAPVEPEAVTPPSDAPNQEPPKNVVKEPEPQPQEYLYGEAVMDTYLYSIYVKDDPQAANLHLTIERRSQTGSVVRVLQIVDRNTTIPLGIELIELFDELYAKESKSEKSDTSSMAGTQSNGSSGVVDEFIDTK